jgi:PAS domain S-box-containing protein
VTWKRSHHAIGVPATSGATSESSTVSQNAHDGNGKGPDWLQPEQLLQSLLANVHDYGILFVDLRGWIHAANGGAGRLFGYSQAELQSMHVSRLYPAETLASTESLVRPGWRARKDGKLFWASDTAIPLSGRDRTPQGFIRILQDRTDPHLEQEQLRVSEERFRRLIEDVRDYAIFTLDPRGHVTSWNAGARFIKGYESQEILGSHFSRFYPPDAIERGWPDHELRVAAMEGRFEDEGWRLRKDGSRFWANVVITALRDDSGTLQGFSKITRDLSERRKQDEIQRRSEERFRLLVEAVRDYALFMLDPRGFVTSWNTGAERIHGWSSPEIVGRHFSHFYGAEDIAADRPWHELKQARDSGRLAVEGWRVHKDGTRFLAQVELTPLQDSHGELYGYAHLTQDLTQERHTEALENVAERINEFIGILAHELRNPLAPIRNAAALMGRKGLGDPVLESMRRMIERQSAQLEQIINELLDVSRVARGELSIEHESVNLSDVVQHAVEATRPAVDLREHRLYLSLPEQPVFVTGDQVRLSQCVVNLLSNAAKYTPERGEIRVDLAIDDTRVILTVKDSGIGIRPEMQHRIFDLFAQDKETVSLANGGLGVGLALVRRVVEMHGGRIDAHSEGRGRGSEFAIYLPRHLQETTPPAVSTEGDEVLESPLPRRKILIADDNLDAATALDALLQIMGQETHVVHDGLAAFQAAQQDTPDLVLLDIGMPKLNGYEVATRLRATPQGNSLVLVAITGWGLEADKQRAGEVGFDYHIVKPANVAALRGLILNPTRARPE